MRPSASLLARVFLDTLADAKGTIDVQTVDAVIALAVQMHIPLAQLQREVQKALPRYDNVVRATLSTVSADAGEYSATIAVALEKALAKPVDLHQDKADILGGAMLRVGDDLFDYSIRGALTRAGHALNGK